MMEAMRERGQGRAKQWTAWAAGGQKGGRRVRRGESGSHKQKTERNKLEGEASSLREA